MQLAVKPIGENKMGFLKELKFNVSKATLRRHFYDQNETAKKGRKHIGRTRDLSQVFEKQLANCILQM